MTHPTPESPIEMADKLQEILEYLTDFDEVLEDTDALFLEDTSIYTFAEYGVMSMDKGLVLVCNDGDEKQVFFLTIQER